MLDDGSLENNAVLPALAHQPWQVDSWVYTQRSEMVGAVNPRRKLVLGHLSELEMVQISY
jgi:hypothetical protein